MRRVNRSGRVGRPRGAFAHEDRRADVLEVATREFRIRGYRATRLDEIGEALGVTRAAIYYYYKGKVELLEDICGRSMTSIERAIRDINQVEDPVERLRSFAVIYAVNMGSDAARVFVRDSGELRPQFRRELMERARAINSGAEDILRYGIERGSFAAEFDVSLVVRGLLGTLNSLAEWHRTKRDGKLEDVAEQLVDLLLAGIVVRA